MQTASVVLFVLGGALEVAGILLVVYELRADRKRALEVAAISIPWVSSAPTSSGPKPAAWTTHAAIDREHELAPLRAQSETGEKLKRALLDLLEGNRRARSWGVGLLIAGVLLSTAGNLIALCA